MHLVQSLQQVHAGLEVQGFSLLPGHVRDKSELQAFPVEQPAELCHPLLSQDGAGDLQDLDVVGLEYLLDGGLIASGLIINPQDDILLEGDGRGYFPEGDNVVAIVGLYPFDHEVREGSEEDLLLFGVQREPADVFAVD